MLPTLGDPGPLHELNASQTLTLSAAPFTTEGHALRFKANSTYEIRVRDRSGVRYTGASGPNRVSFRIGRTWKQPEVNGDAFTVETACEEDTSHMWLVTTTRADETPYEVTIEVVRKMQPLPSCCVDTGQHDRCVAGSWALDKEEMLRVLSEINPKVTWQMPTGELRRQFDADGRIRGAQNSLMFRGTINFNSGRTAPFSVNIAAQGDGRWSTEERQILHTCPTREESRVDTKIAFPGLPAESRTYTPPGAVAGLSVKYTCSGDSLTVTLPGGRMRQVYRRVGGPPAP